MNVQKVNKVLGEYVPLIWEQPNTDVSDTWEISKITQPQHTQGQAYKYSKALHWSKCKCWQCIQTLKTRFFLPDVYILRLLTYGYQLIHHTTHPSVIYIINAEVPGCCVVGETPYKGMHSPPDPSFSICVSVCLSFPHSLNTPTQVSKTNQHRIQ